MAKYRKKPVVIDAHKWEGNWENAKEFCPELIDGGADHSTSPIVSWPVFIRTLEGTMTAVLGDWIIKGVNGEYYPCKPDIFEKTYEPA